MFFHTRALHAVQTIEMERAPVPFVWVRVSVYCSIRRQAKPRMLKYWDYVYFCCCCCCRFGCCYVLPALCVYSIVHVHTYRCRKRLSVPYSANRIRFLLLLSIHVSSVWACVCVPFISKTFLVCVLVSSRTRTRYKFDICKRTHTQSIGWISAIRNSCFIIGSLFYQRYFFICGIWHFALSAYRTICVCASAAAADKHVCLRVYACVVCISCYGLTYLYHYVCVYISLYRHSVTDSTCSPISRYVFMLLLHSCFFVVVRFWLWYCALCAFHRPFLS